LQNIRFVASTEVEDGARMSESLIKSMTGGDKIAARFLYKEFIEFTPKYKLFIAGNHKPLIRGTDEGIWRRIHLVPFDVTISKHKRDGALPEKLKSEMSGILNWLIEGCLKYQKERLALPPVMKEALEEYQDEMDTLGLWIKDCCTIGDDCRARGEQIYKSYSQWSLDNGFQSSSSAAFYRRISERFEKKRSSNGNYYSGISVNSVIP
jgi:putative DNA primase/helicase